MASTPLGSGPPSSIRTRSRSARCYSDEERGGRSALSSPPSSGTRYKSHGISDSNGSGSPLPTKALSFEDCASVRPSTRRCLHGSTLLVLLSCAAISWAPVLRWALIKHGARHYAHGARDDARGAHVHVHAFHEPGCAGESVTLHGGGSDLCGLTYASGAEVQDNVLSVLLAGAGGSVDVYATCWVAERPADESARRARARALPACERAAPELRAPREPRPSSLDSNA